MSLTLANRFMDYCTTHYEQGWDFIVECYTKDELAATFAKDGITSLKGAIARYKGVRDVREDRRADAAQYMEW